MSARQDVLSVIASIKPYRDPQKAAMTYGVHECSCCFGPEYACGWNKAIEAINAAVFNYLDAEPKEMFKTIYSTLPGMAAGKGPDEGGK